MLQLLISMTKRRVVFLRDVNGRDCMGIVWDIQAEDGSGTSFSVRAGEDVVYLKRPVGSGLHPDDPIRSSK